MFYNDSIHQFKPLNFLLIVAGIAEVVGGVVNDVLVRANGSFCLAAMAADMGDHFLPPGFFSVIIISHLRKNVKKFFKSRL